MLLPGGFLQYSINIKINTTKHMVGYLECSYQVNFYETRKITSMTKGKVARGVFGDWRVAPFTSLKLNRMK